MKYIKTMENRKELVKKLEELTGKRAVYTRMPECAFVIDDYKVLKDGTLELSEGADMEPIEALLAEGLIRPYEADATNAPEADATNAPEADATNAPEADATNASEGENTNAPEADATNTPEGDALNGPEGEDTNGPEGENEEAAAGSSEEASAEATYEPAEHETPRPQEGGVAIAFPLGAHGVVSLRNLVNMICARGPLISKATGGDFSCTQDLAEALAPITDKETFMATLRDHSDELHGLEIEGPAIRFTGFPDEPEKAMAFNQFATMMNKAALEAKRILPRPVVEENERYIFRIWLVRLGMAGQEYAQARKILLEPLSGNSAFKDKAMEDRWKEKRKVRAAAPTTSSEGEATTSTEETEAGHPSGETEATISTEAEAGHPSEAAETEE